MPTLDFRGKQHIYAHHLTVPHRPLVADASKSESSHVSSGGGGKTLSVPDDNLIIHGDNLHALKALLPRYAGRVDCIYIDPPYNTGNEGWTYNDNVNSPLMREWLADNSPVDGEDLQRHDKWLCMMWPRLQLLKELLADDGAIFISIDDNEQHHLRMLMEELWGEEQFIASVTWKKRGGPPNDRPIGNVHDVVLIYGSEPHLMLRPREDAEEQFSNPDNGPRGPWRLQQLHGNTRGGRWVDSLYYGISNPDTGEEHFPPPNRNWIHNQARVAEMIASGDVVFGRDGKGAPQRKRFLSDARPGYTWSTIWEADKHGTFPLNRNASAELTEIFGGPSEFDTPKPVGLIDRVLRMRAGPDAIVLDSFAGSGTTAHAVLALNKEDGGNRRFILVECEDYADTITAERIRRVIHGVPEAKEDALREGLGGSFTYCTLGDPIDPDEMLAGETLPEFEQLAAHLLYTASGRSAPEPIRQTADDEPFYSDEETDYYLRYRPDADWLRGNEAMLGWEFADAISERGRSAIVFAAGKLMSQRDLTQRRIVFCQLPFELYRTR